MNCMAAIGMLIPVLTGAAPALGGVLEISTPIVEETRLTFPVILGGDVGDGVSALDFRFNYDPSMFRLLLVSEGPAVIEADKRIEWSVPIPGECIVVMMGMNRTLCQPGELAQVVLQRVAEPGAGEYEFAVNQPTFASSDGKVISAEGSRETVSFADEQDVPTDGIGAAEPATDTGAAQTSEDDGQRPETAPETFSPPELIDVARGPPAPPLTAERPSGLGRDNASRAPTVDRQAQGGLDPQRLAAVDGLRNGLPRPGPKEGAARPGEPEEKPLAKRAAEETLSAASTDADGPTSTGLTREAQRDRSGQTSGARGAADPTQPRPRDEARPATTWAIAVAALLVVLIGLLLARRKLFA